MNTNEHHFDKSLPFEAGVGCPKKYHKREAYTTQKGKYVPARCVKAVTRKMKPVSSKKLDCPPGFIERSQYVRKYTTAIRKEGYLVKKPSGKTYKVYPKESGQYVGPSCIKDRGLKGKGPQTIGPLRKGELTRFGYSTQMPSDIRQAALKKAISELGALNVYHKLDAVGKLAVRVAPDASRIFIADRDWVRANYPLKAV